MPRTTPLRVCALSRTGVIECHSRGGANELCVCTVVARFRPQNKVELGSGGQPIVDFENEETCEINVRLRPHLPWVCVRAGTDAA